MLNDLVFVLNHIKKLIEEYGLPDLYTNFANTLQQISQSSTEELQAQLKDHKSRIKEAHERLEPSGWSHSQLQIYDRFGARNIVGNVGYTNFQKALTENAANTPGAIQEINNQQQQITQLLTNASNILSSLGALAEEEKISEDLAVIQIVFDEDVKIDNLSQLATHSKEWKDIIRAFSLLAGEAPEKTNIIAISKGSPLSMWLTTLPLISRAIYYTVKPFLDLWKQYLEGKEHVLALEKMEIEVNSDRFKLFKKIDEYSRKRITEIMESVANDHHIEGLGEEKLNEAKNALLKAGPELFEFITKGGKVDASKNEESSEVQANFQLEPTYQEVHKLRDNVLKLLSAGIKKEEKVEVKIKKKDGARSKKRGRPKKITNETH